MAAMTWEGACADVDPPTMRTIIQLQLEDSEAMAAKAKGKQREGEKTDAQLAMEMYVQDLKSFDTTLQDRNMAQSLATAVLQDGDLIAESFRQEQQLAEDREIAARLADGGNVASARSAAEQDDHSSKRQKRVHEDPWDNQEMLDKAAAIYMQLPPEQAPQHVDDDDDSDTTVAESSAWAASRKQLNKPALRSCIACGEDKEFFELARAPCNHEYCRPCLKELFTLSMKDETLFPPRCDNKEISLDRVRLFLPADVAKEFESKYDELSTHNRTYCHDGSCSAFIPSDLHDGETASCPSCSRTTCAGCKGASHSGDCPNDEALQQLIEVANAAQWQRCYSCSRFVEIESGCNHMRCKCGAQFCYVCGERWKTCGCPQWHEERLYGRAVQIADRNPRRRLFQPARVEHAQPAARPQTPVPVVTAASRPSSSRPAASLPAATSTSVWQSDFSDHSVWEEDWASGEEGAVREVEAPASIPQNITPAASLSTQDRDRRIAEIIEHLRHNHECEHDQWRWVKGRHECEECHHVLKRYIFECRQCNLQACNRCRRNRL